MSRAKILSLIDIVEDLGYSDVIEVFEMHESDE